MKTITQVIPGYKIAEYRLVLNPHEDLRRRIMNLKREFGENYDAPMALTGKPNITLVRFKQLEIFEERIVNRLQAISMGFQPFKVELKDFGSFPSHTIFINVITKILVQNLVKEIRPVQRLLKLDAENKPHFIDEPYIVIARKLVPWQYEKGWLEYSHRQFTGRFIADGMLLLKRREGSKAYQIVKRFEFMNLPVTTKQGELFS